MAITTYLDPRGRPPVGFNNWAEADSYTAPAASGPDPATQAILDAAEARRAASRSAQEAFNAQIAGQIASQAAAANKAARATDEAMMAIQNQVQSAAEARVKAGIVADEALKATPGYTYGGQASPVIDFDTPGANPYGGYFGGRDPLTVTEESRLAALGPIGGRGLPGGNPGPRTFIPPPEGTVSGFNNMNIPLPTSQGWKEAIVGAVGGFLTGGPGGAIAGGLGGLGVGGDPRGAGLGTGSGFAASQCPTGYKSNGVGGCDKVGITGTLERWVPGGQTGTYSPPGGVGNMVGFGGVAPQLVTTQKRVCPKGGVLGIDGNCYPRQMLPKQFRAWRPGPKPLLSAQDGKILRRAMSLENKLNRVAGRFLAPPRTVRKKKGRGRGKR